MEINNKFEIGQTVYYMSDKKYQASSIKEIVISMNGDKPAFSYMCDNGIHLYLYNENQLAATKPEPELIKGFVPGDIIFLISENKVEMAKYDINLHYGYVIHNDVFKTREEADVELYRRELRYELRDLAGNGGKFNEFGDNWCMRFDYVNRDIVVVKTNLLDDLNVIYFPTKEAAENAVKLIGKLKLIGYYFGVKLKNAANDKI